MPFDWPAMAPMIAVFLTGVVAMVVEMLSPRRTNNLIVGVCLVGLGFAASLVVRIWDHSANSLGGLFTDDRFGHIMQLAIIGIAFLTVLYSEGYLRERRLPFGEYYPLVLWSALGAMIMSTSRDLLIIFLGLEVLSIALYVLSGLSSREKKSQESALKYFLLGAFATGFLLYGISFVYGATGSTNISSISALVSMGKDVNPTNIKLLYAGLGLILVGFGFKTALVPFHMWTPDVYQGAPTSVTGFMAACVKVGAFAALARFLYGAADLRDVWLPILMVLAALTMTVGNLIALVQKDAKRILGYSSIAHAGYVLVALAAYGALQGTAGAIGYNTLAYYLLSYAAMTVGAFAVLSLSARNGQEGTLLEDFHGMYRRAPFLAAAMIIFMASLAGIPLTAGFLGKLLIFKDALSAGMVWLAIVLAVNSVISAFYYLRIVVAISVQKPELREPQFGKVNAGLVATCAVSAVIVLGMFFGYQPLVAWIGL
ncbi:MAG TPA: NADH-quinone oxidoreductase subunit N [Fimbriimonadales bacterium]|nr:NADH-quinone oxidoreductase subunit N [Fimbriimonadales bacterium]